MTTADLAAHAQSIPASRKVLCAVYGAIAVAGLLATLIPNLAYTPAGFMHDFMNDLRTTPASRSYTGDLLLLALAAVLFMLVEARKLGIKLVWIYIVGGFATAISFTFPLFLIARELRVGTSDALRLRAADAILFTAITAMIAGNIIWIGIE